MKKETEKHLNKAKDFISCAIEELKEIPMDADEIDVGALEGCILDLQDIQLFRL